MDQLLAKLTNLSFDFFSILLPGVISSIFVLLLWYALGPLVPTWTSNGIPEFTFTVLLCLVDTLSLNISVFAVISLVLLWYFFGHLLNWLGVKRIAEYKILKPKEMSAHTLVLHSLIFRILNPQPPYDPEFEPLFKTVQKNFALENIELKWDSLKPVVLSYLANNLSRSQVTYYQNKYILHRSIAIASTFLFWFSLLSIFVGLVMSYCYGVHPHWIFLIALLIVSLALVWAFSGSYWNNFDLFSSSIVTEAYSLLHDHKRDGFHPLQ
ncbi:MAG: hypothetical protein WAW75_08855 [Gallionella sp.]